MRICFGGDKKIPNSPQIIGIYLVGGTPSNEYQKNSQTRGLWNEVVVYCTSIY